MILEKWKSKLHTKICIMNLDELEKIIYNLYISQKIISKIDDIDEILDKLYLNVSEKTEYSKHFIGSINQMKEIVDTLAKMLERNLSELYICLDDDDLEDKIEYTKKQIITLLKCRIMDELKHELSGNDALNVDKIVNIYFDTFNIKKIGTPIRDKIKDWLKYIHSSGIQLF